MLSNSEKYELKSCANGTQAIESIEGNINSGINSA